MIDFQIEKVKILRGVAKDTDFPREHDIRKILVGLCDVVLELLATEKMRKSDVFPPQHK